MGVRVAVTGASGPAVGIVVRHLGGAGFDAVELALPRSRQALGDTARALEGISTVIDVASSAPWLPAQRWRREWRDHDRVRAEAVPLLVEAAIEAGVRRLVHRSSSFVYADGADDWLDETSPVCITTGTEATSVGETAVLGFASSCRSAVVLRMGQVLGDSRATRVLSLAIGQRRPLGLGPTQGFVHVLHSDDVAPALAASCSLPTGIYNVGAAPVRRRDFVDTFARAAGRRSGTFLGPVSRRLAGRRGEPMSRSLRVSSDAFATASGWTAGRPVFDADWFDLQTPHVLGRIGAVS